MVLEPYLAKGLGSSHLTSIYSSSVNLKVHYHLGEFGHLTIFICVCEMKFFICIYVCACLCDIIFISHFICVMKFFMPIKLFMCLCLCMQVFVCVRDIIFIMNFGIN